MSSEFELIRRFFARPARSAVLGVGDDCALVAPEPGNVLAVTTDMLLAGRHFFPDADPEKLGHKALAVNLSDLAAMGARPCWALLAIALPEADDAWLAAFARGFFALADRHGVELVGGDTNRGPLAIAITAIGQVPQAQALRREGARAGDDVWLSGATGEAALALAHLRGRARLEPRALEDCLARLHTPEPRVALGERLRGIASASIDVSDGLLADLGHIAESSAVGAEVSLELVPRAAALAACRDETLARACLLAGGDDYELAFTAPAGRRAELEALARELGLRLTRIGRIAAGNAGVRLLDAAGATVPAPAGWDHFR
ncbi:MAG TPA: thiamine-phosphate kinase [Burkholderiales bacterium]|nr:thiamine-phosphate kinase [Burkholderiales bacterium]